VTNLALILLPTLLVVDAVDDPAESFPPDHAAFPPDRGCRAVIVWILAPVRARGRRSVSVSGSAQTFPAAIHPASICWFSRPIPSTRGSGIATDWLTSMTNGYAENVASIPRVALITIGLAVVVARFRPPIS
jgi:hypothetical protein